LKINAVLLPLEIKNEDFLGIHCNHRDNRRRAEKSNYRARKNEGLIPAVDFCSSEWKCSYMSKVMVELSEGDPLKLCLGIVKEGNIAVLCDKASPVAEVGPVHPAPSANSGKKRKLGLYPGSIQLVDVQGQAGPTLRPAGTFSGKIWTEPDFNDPDPELEKIWDESIFP
jgi:hypothetical protein